MSRFHTVPVWLLEYDENYPFRPDKVGTGRGNAFYVLDPADTDDFKVDGEPIPFKKINSKKFAALPKAFAEQVRMWCVLKGALNHVKDWTV